MRGFEEMAKYFWYGTGDQRRSQREMAPRKMKLLRVRGYDLERGGEDLREKIVPVKLKPAFEAWCGAVGIYPALDGGLGLDVGSGFFSIGFSGGGCCWRRSYGMLGDDSRTALWTYTVKHDDGSVVAMYVANV